MTRRKIRMPLWLKLGAILGSLSAFSLLLDGYLDYRESLELADSQLEARLTGHARTVAQLVTPEEIETLLREDSTETETFLKVQRRLADFLAANDLGWVGLFGRDETAYYYIVDVDTTDPMPVRYPLFFVSPALRQAFEGVPGVTRNHVDEWGVWDAADVPIKGPDGNVLAVAEADLAAEWRTLLQKERVSRTVARVAGAAFLLILVAVGVSRYVGQPLLEVVGAAQRVSRGDLTVVVINRRNDEVGELARAFNHMVQRLRDGDFIRDAFARFVNPDLASRMLERPDELAPGGERRVVTILMSDLRGFTSFAESRSPEELTELLNRYLGLMNRVVEDHGGFVVSFIGDAILAVFGAMGSAEDDPVRAVACAVEMQRALATFNEGREDIELEMGIGLNTGPVIVGPIGSEARLQYDVIGDAVNLAARVESFTVGGEVFISESTLEAAGDVLETRGPAEVMTKGKKDPLRIHSVVAVGAPFDVRLPEQERREDLTDVDFGGELWRLEGKTIEATVHPAKIWQLGRRSLVLETSAELRPLDDVKLTLRLADDRVLEEVYGKVRDLDPEGKGAWVVITSIDATDRARLEGYLSGKGHNGRA